MRGERTPDYPKRTPGGFITLQRAALQKHLLGIIF